MSHHAFTVRSPLRLLPGTVLLVLAVLWAQLLGLAHGVLHVHGWHAPDTAHDPAPGHADAHTHGHAHEHAHPHAHAHADGAHGLLAHLLAPAADEEGCRLFDPLAQDVPASAPALVLPSAVPLLPAWVVLQALQPRPCVAFAARAPPVSR